MSLSIINMNSLKENNYNFNIKDNLLYSYDDNNWKTFKESQPSNILKDEEELITINKTTGEIYITKDSLTKDIYFKIKDDRDKAILNYYYDLFDFTYKVKDEEDNEVDGIYGIDYTYEYNGNTQSQILSFKKSGTFIPGPHFPNFIDIHAVGGGGGGGQETGGGGGSGYANTVFKSNITPLINYKIEIGEGGKGGNFDKSTNSTFVTKENAVKTTLQGEEYWVYGDTPKGGSENAYVIDPTGDDNSLATAGQPSSFGTICKAEGGQYGYSHAAKIESNSFSKIGGAGGSGGGAGAGTGSAAGDGGVNGSSGADSGSGQKGGVGAAAKPEYSNDLYDFKDTKNILRGFGGGGGGNYGLPGGVKQESEKFVSTSGTIGGCNIGETSSGQFLSEVEESSWNFSGRPYGISGKDGAPNTGNGGGGGGPESGRFHYRKFEETINGEDRTYLEKISGRGGNGGSGIVLIRPAKHIRTYNILFDKGEFPEFKELKNFYGCQFDEDKDQLSFTSIQDITITNSNYNYYENAIPSNEDTNIQIHNNPESKSCSLVRSLYPLPLKFNYLYFNISEISDRNNKINFILSTQDSNYNNWDPEDVNVISENNRLLVQPIDHIGLYKIDLSNIKNENEEAYFYFTFTGDANQSFSISKIYFSNY